MRRRKKQPIRKRNKIPEINIMVEVIRREKKGENSFFRIINYKFVILFHRNFKIKLCIFFIHFFLFC